MYNIIYTNNIYSKSIHVFYIIDMFPTMQRKKFENIKKRENSITEGVSREVPRCGQTSKWGAQIVVDKVKCLHNDTL